MPRPSSPAPAPRPKHAKAEAEALFASIGEGVIATDEHGKIVRVNQIALDILGYTESEVLDKWFPEVVVAIREDGSMVEALDRPITKTTLTGAPVTDRLIYMNNEGQTTPVSVTTSAVMIDGKPKGVIQVFRDITNEIQQDKLKSDFISLASHQLRTPLSSIHLYSEMLHGGYAGALNDDQRTFVKTIVSAVDRMNSLINMLLNITRIEAGSIMVTPEMTRMSALASEVILEFTPEAEAKQIKLKYTRKDAALDCLTDPLLVKEVLGNLMSNAIKYTPEGGTVTLAIDTKANDVIISVKDTGYGIPLAGQRRIFSKFYRADNVLEHDVSGTGLGLYMVKIIVENLQGDIWFESREKHGSTFFVALPRSGPMAKVGKFKIERHTVNVV